MRSSYGIFVCVLLRRSAPLKWAKWPKSKQKFCTKEALKKISKSLKNNYFKLVNNQYLFSFFLFLGGTTAPLFSHTRRPCPHDRSFLYPKKVSFPVTLKKGGEIEIVSNQSQEAENIFIGSLKKLNTICRIRFTNFQNFRLCLYRSMGAIQ